METGERAKTRHTSVQIEPRMRREKTMSQDSLETRHMSWDSITGVKVLKELKARNWDRDHHTVDRVLSWSTTWLLKEEINVYADCPTLTGNSTSTDHFSGPGQAVGPVCVSPEMTFEQNDLDTFSSSW